jgi:hypothetical protein
MPSRVNIDETRGLVEIVLTGKVTESEVRELVARHIREPQATFPLGLWDLLDTTSIELPSSVIRDVANRAARHVDPRLDQGKLAILAGDEEIFGLGRMYEILRSDSPVEVRVFRRRDEAELWLGLAENATHPRK